MQVEHPRADAITKRQRRTEVGACRRMDQPACSLAIDLQRHIGSVAWCGSGFDNNDPRVREREAHGRLEIVSREGRARVRDETRLRLINLPQGNAAPHAPGVVVWAGRKAEDPPAVATARTAMLDDIEDEYRRLLYVAMTRAADRLIVGGCLPGNLRNVRPDSWYADWLALPEAERGQVRTYTVRSVMGKGADRRVIVDFVLHEPSGPAGAFAASAKVGDVVGMLAPRRGREGEFGGIEFRPGAARRLWFVADETAVPALASILESLPPDANGWAVAEVPNAADIQHVATPTGVTVDWLVRGSRSKPCSSASTRPACRSARCRPKRTKRWPRR